MSGKCSFKSDRKSTLISTGSLGFLCKNEDVWTQVGIERLAFFVYVTLRRGVSNAAGPT